MRSRIFTTAPTAASRTDDNGSVSWTFYDGMNPLLVLDGAGSEVVRRLYGRGVDDIMAEEVSGTVHWFLTDPVGSVRDLVDNSAVLVDHYVYDSFGRLLSTPSSSNSLLANAREYDGSGLGYYRARYYDPLSGRFLSTDPRLPFRYEFAASNPLLFTDPSGETISVEYTILIVEVASLFCELAGGYDDYNDLTAFHEAWSAPIIAALNGDPIPKTNVLKALADFLTPDLCGFGPDLTE